MPHSPSDSLLATDFGLDALYEAALDAGVSTGEWPRAADGDTLVDWLLAREGEPAIARVLVRARIRVRYRGPVPARVELALAEAPRAAWRDLARALRAELGAFLAERGLPDAGAVRASRRGGSVRFAVDLPSRWMRVDTAAGETSLAYRIAHARVELRGAHVVVTAASAAHVGLLVAALGRACSGDARALRPVQIVSLHRLQRGRRVLRVPEELRDRILRVRLIEYEWDGGRTATVSVSGRDCWKEMRRLGLHIEGGALLSAVLRFDYVDGSLPTDVTLRAQNELVCGDLSREPLVRACLAKQKVLTRAAPRRDLWSSEPWEETERAARATFGEAFDSLLEDRVLVRSRARAVAHPDAEAAGRRLIAFPIEGEPGRWYGVAQDARFASRTLDAEDLGTVRLVPRALGRRIARALRLRGRVALLERGGVVDLGVFAIGSTYARLFLVLRAPVDAKALAARLRLRASPGHAVLVVPAGRSAKTGLAEVPLGRVEGPYGALVEAAARALGLHDALDPPLLAPPGTRVVVHRASRRVWFDGVLLRELREVAYRLVEILAGEQGRTRTVKELAMELSAGKDTEAMRRAKHLLLAAIKASFAREGRAAPQDSGKIVERVRRGEVRMGVAAFVT